MALGNEETEGESALRAANTIQQQLGQSLSIDKLLWILPWSQNPSIQHLRYISSRNWLSSDKNGSAIATLVEEIATASTHFVSRTTPSLVDHQHKAGASSSSALLEQACKSVRIQTVLQVVDDQNAFMYLAAFMRLGITDDMLPLSLDRISRILDDPIHSQTFWKLQFWILPSPKVLGNFNHIEFQSKLHIPLLHLATLGHGTYAAVDSVKDVMTNKLYARKVFKPIAKRKYVLAGFQQEMDILRRLERHPHIVTYAGSYVGGSELGILLAPIADRNMRDFLDSVADEGLSSDGRTFLRNSLGCLMSGLAFMHKNRIRHKDIKPANILIHGKNVLFADFGLALDFDRLTTSATTGPVGAMTKKYSAREVHECERRDTRADVYSLGCVFLEICTVLADLGLEALEETLTGDSGDSWWEEGIYAFNTRAVEEQIDRIEKTKLVGEPMEWCRLLLRDDSRERPRIQAFRDSIYGALRNRDRGGIYFCHSCLLQQEQELMVSNITVDRKTRKPLPQPLDNLHSLAYPVKHPDEMPLSVESMESETSPRPERSSTPLDLAFIVPRQSKCGRPVASSYDPNNMRTSFGAFELFFTWSMFEQLVNVYSQKSIKGTQFSKNALLHLNIRKQSNRIERMHGRALCLACSLGDVDLIQRLLRAGVRPNFSDILCEEEGEIESSEQPVVTLYPPFIMAALEGQEGALKLLIKYGADINVADAATGATALHLVARRGSTLTLEFLLNIGVDLERRDLCGETALFCAIRRDRCQSTHVSSDSNSLPLLLSHDANLDVQNDLGLTALHTTAKAGHKALSVLLLQNGADPEIRDHKGWNALHYAVLGCGPMDEYQANGNRQLEIKEIIAELLEHGVDIGSETKDHLTALSIAIELGQKEMEKFLIENGASKATIRGHRL